MQTMATKQYDTTVMTETQLDAVAGGGRSRREWLVLMDPRRYRGCNPNLYAKPVITVEVAN